MKSFWSRTGSVFLAAVLLAGLVGWSPASAQPPRQSYIVQAASAAQAAGLVEGVGGEVTSQLDLIHGVGASLTADQLLALRSAPGARLTLNQEVASSEAYQSAGGNHVPATDYPDVSGADKVWQAGYTGAGVGVAILDSGIGLHPDLLIDMRGRSRQITGWVDFVDNKNPNPLDPYGHGTHIAGIIANSQIGSDNEWNGMAPGVNLVGVRVLDKTGHGNYEGIIQGIQWAIVHKAEYNIRVINLSLQAAVQSPYWADPLDQAVTRAWAEGIVVVTVAGNNGSKPMTISVPGNNPYAITVGAFTDHYTPADWSDDYITPFSSAGPTLDGFAKPDLVAPGAHIVSTMPRGSYIARNHEADWIDGKYFSMAGTSQASAVVAGTVALMLSRNPALTPDQVKYRLQISALPWLKADQSDVLYSIWQQGAGRLNAYDAVLSDSPEMNGMANRGMDIQADLNGAQHYEGYSYYDEATGTFRLRGTDGWTGNFGAWSGNFGAWSGSFGAWSGGFGAWSGNFGAWSGGFGAWSGNFGAWSGGFGAWSGGFGAWSGGFGAWSGGFGAWSGGFGAWSGSVPWASSAIADPAFVTRFMQGQPPQVASLTASIVWAGEPAP